MVYKCAQRSSHTAKCQVSPTFDRSLYSMPLFTDYYPSPTERTMVNQDIHEPMNQGERITHIPGNTVVLKTIP